MAKLNEDLLPALYMLGFNIDGGEVAEIKGEMSIKVLRRCSSELKLNFSRAARRCGVSQPSLSIAISTLERELGGALFDRKPSIALTVLGRVVRPYLEEISRNADCAREVARTLTPAS